ncbi:MAG: cytochrome c oxidase subunit 3 family protein [Planctomycetota bacterium]
MSSTATETAHDAHHFHDDQAWHLAHHFETPHQQFDSGKLGTWLFLVTEVLFFSGLFVAYGVYRMTRPELFTYASGYLDTKMGAINTVVLIFSSLTAAWAVRCAQLGNRKGLTINIVLTLMCAAGFMVIKYLEYSHKIHIGLFPGAPAEPGQESMWNFNPEWAPGEKVHFADDPNAPALHDLKNFFGVYFCMTGLHGIHVMVGMGLWIWMLIRNLKGQFGPKFYGPVDFVALYWHIVDIIWIFLFPLLYLIRH